MRFPSHLGQASHWLLAAGTTLCMLLSLGACSDSGAASADGTPPPTTSSQIGDYPAGSGVWRGYLAPSAWPDSLALLPPPPVTGLPPYLADQYAFESTRAAEKGARGEVAKQDADLSFPHAPNQFACALGMDIQADRSPHLNALLRRTFADAGLATYKAKNYYNRVRPFVVNKTSTCLPSSDAALAKDGSYPSGHTAIGWTWALLLSEVSPERTNALLQRGLAFGQSRVVCGAHWQSDVDNGRLVAAGVVARLHSDAVFRAQMALAQQEVAVLRQTVTASTRDCAAEAAALGTGTGTGAAAGGSDAPALPPSLASPSAASAVAR
ncbi:phosphatase PAP2 family protein [Curvibacter sp. RS43]|uniref:acid phosphatase n=1 Tax=Curvibacter microcysteis TaxID=3026419 RepID=UPI00235E07E9|nr:phosphatase PAP2 family protein [Curvibacter sp. RS43]MDD0811297.1 phosphatase PAP2 family protein [Curvibacter sp. RS43]